MKRGEEERRKDRQSPEGIGRGDALREREMDAEIEAM